jgi:hypothetical protein
VNARWWAEQRRAGPQFEHVSYQAQHQNDAEREATLCMRKWLLRKSLRDGGALAEHEQDGGTQAGQSVGLFGTKEDILDPAAQIVLSLQAGGVDDH